MKDSLTKLDFQLAYLAMLTKTQIKPLSRWEKKNFSQRVKNPEKTWTESRKCAEKTLERKTYLRNYL